MHVRMFTPKLVQQARKSAKLYQAAKVHKPKPSVFVNHSKSHFPLGVNPPYTKINTNSSQPLLPLPNTTKIVKAKHYTSHIDHTLLLNRMKGGWTGCACIVMRNILQVTTLGTKEPNYMCLKGRMMTVAGNHAFV